MEVVIRMVEVVEVVETMLLLVELEVVQEVEEVVVRLHQLLLVMESARLHIHFPLVVEALPQPSC